MHREVRTPQGQSLARVTTTDCTDRPIEVSLGVNATIGTPLTRSEALALLRAIAHALKHTKDTP